MKLDRKAHKVRPESAAYAVNQEKKESKDRLVQWDHRVSKAFLVSKENVVNVEKLALLDQRDLLVHEVYVEKRVRKVTKVTLVKRVNLVLHLN